MTAMVFDPLPKIRIKTSTCRECCSCFRDVEAEEETDQKKTS